MYHKELEIKETTETAFSSSFRHFLTFKYDTNGQLSTRRYDKRDDFHFANINLEYGVYFSQLIRSILSFAFSPFTTLPYSKFQKKGEVRTKTKKHEQTDKEAVHIEALDVVREVIYSQFIILKTIVKLTQLRDISIEKLEKKLGLQIPATGVKIYRET